MPFIKLNDLICENAFIKPYGNACETGKFNILNAIPNINEKGRLSVFVSRPGSGKSTLLLQTAICFAYFKNTPCYIFSTQMPNFEIVYRVLKMFPNINVLKRLPIWIYNSENLSVDEIETAVNGEIKDGTVFIDSFESVKSPSRRRTIAKLNALAKEQSLPIVFSASILTGEEGRWYEREEICPKLSDLPYIENVDNAVILFREPWCRYNSRYKINKYANCVKVITVKSTSVENKMKFLEWMPERYYFREKC